MNAWTISWSHMKITKLLPYRDSFLAAALAITMVYVLFNSGGEFQIDGPANRYSAVQAESSGDSSDPAEFALEEQNHHGGPGGEKDDSFIHTVAGSLPRLDAEDDKPVSGTMDYARAVYTPDSAPQGAKPAFLYYTLSIFALAASVAKGIGKTRFDN
ncbi:hypothetical protein ACX93W_23480 [Paenibacillus sp. CAU 1782]